MFSLVAFAQPPATQLIPTDCNITLDSINQLLQITGATGAIDYQYEYTEVITAAVYDTMRGNGLFSFWSTNLDSVTYNKTYDVRVRGWDGALFGPWGATCQITTPVWPTTFVDAGHCGTTLTNIWDRWYLDHPITHTIKYGYRFAEQGGTDTIYYPRFSPITDNWFSRNPGIKYATTYDIAVYPKVGTDWGPLGPSCAITTPNFPPTKIQTPYCGTMVANINSIFLCDTIYGAQNYQYEFVTGTDTIYANRGSGSEDMWFSAVQGIQYAQIYTIRVRGIIGSQYGPWGLSCNITTPPWPTTRLTIADCGSTIANVTDSFYIDPIIGVDDYLYEFIIPGVDTIYDYRGGPMLHNRFSRIQGFRYASTYNTRVRGIINGQLGPWGPVCLITTPPFPSTKVQPIYCGTTTPAFNSFFYCDEIIGAQDYTWELTSGPITLVDVRGSPLENNWFSGVNGATYATTYDVRVRAKVGGVWGPWGVSCPIRSPEWPTTQVESADCNQTYLLPVDTFWCVPIIGADNYRWHFTDQTDFITYEQDRITGAPNMWFGKVHTVNHLSGRSFDVKVKAQVGTDWSVYGPSCILYYDEGAEIWYGIEEQTQDDKHAKIYPNPSGGREFFVEIESEHKAILDISLFDAFGKLVHSEATAASNTAPRVVPDKILSPGIYLVQITAGDSSFHGRVIVQ